MKNILLPILLVASFSANAALLDGKTVSYQYYYPSQSTPYSNASNGNHLVDAGVEVSNVADNMATLDISDTNIYIDYSGLSNWSHTSFNGFKITDVFSDIADFTSVSINSATNMVGFDLSRITVLADSIWVNWQGLSFTSGTIVSLDINQSAVPIPAAAFLFAPALLGFMGLRRKAKNSVV